MSYSILGLAKSGVAAANALAQRGESVLASDLRPESALKDHLDKLHPSVEVVLESNTMRSGDTVVVSPGIRPSAPVFADAKKLGCEVIGEIELFQRLKGNVPVLAVTGTDGKSTTTTWLGEMCAASGRPTWVGGNLGTPLCASLDELTPDHIVVAEVSCFQLWTSEAFHPQVAVFTNLAPDHLDYHGSFEAYTAAKAVAMANLGPGETAIMNRDDIILNGWVAPNGAATWHYSRHERVEQGVFQIDGALVAITNGIATPLVNVSKLLIPGAHNVENAMAAAAAALAFGIDVDAVIQGLTTYRGLEHRIERVRTVDGVTWYNDSKATNPHAAEAALKAFDTSPVLICGGSEKGSDFEPWAKMVSERCRHVVCYGQTGPRMAAVLDGLIPLSTVGTLQEAIREANRAADGQGVVVLSPACASFDQFKSYEDRGRQFKNMVLELPLS